MISPVWCTSATYRWDHLVISVWVLHDCHQPNDVLYTGLYTSPMSWPVEPPSRALPMDTLLGHSYKSLVSLRSSSRSEDRHTEVKIKVRLTYFISEHSDSCLSFSDVLISKNLCFLLLLHIFYYQLKKQNLYVCSFTKKGTVSNCYGNNRVREYQPQNPEQTDLHVIEWNKNFIPYNHTTILAPTNYNQSFNYIYYIPDLNSYCVWSAPLHRINFFHSNIAVTTGKTKELPKMSAGS